MSQVYVFIASKTTADVALPTQAREQSEYNRRVSNAFRAQAGGRLTVGDLKLRPNGNAIPNHLLCDGSAVGRTNFPELFRLLGTVEGPGDGSTTFNLPNYLGTYLEVPASAPPQATTAGGTIASNVAITSPTAPGETGGTSGGNIVSGGRPGTTATSSGTASSDSSFGTISSTTMTTVSDELVITIGSGGFATLTASLHVTPAALEVGGVWQRFDTVTGLWVNVDAGYIDTDYIEIKSAAESLSPGSSQRFRLQMRRTSGVGTVSFTGNARAVGS